VHFPAKFGSLNSISSVPVDDKWEEQVPAGNCIVEGLDPTTRAESYTLLMENEIKSKVLESESNSPRKMKLLEQADFINALLDQV
jgi:subtilase family serine protease